MQVICDNNVNTDKVSITENDRKILLLLSFFATLGSFLASLPVSSPLHLIDKKALLTCQFLLHLDPGPHYFLGRRW